MEFKTTEGRTLQLRAATLEDFGWLQQKFGSKIQAEMNDLKNISTVIYRLLKNKSEFPLEEIEDFDDDGRKKQMTITGPMQVARALKGMHDMASAAQALGKALGVGDIIEEKLAEQGLNEAPQTDSEVKKNQ